MEKTTKKEENGQGPKVLTEEEFYKMIKRDLQTGYSFLAAIYNDEPTTKALNEYLYGRYLNQLHKAELENQTKLEV